MATKNTTAAQKAPAKTNGKKSAAAAPAPAPKASRTRFDYTQPFRVADRSSVKVGYILDVVNWLEKKGTATREEMVAAFRKDERGGERGVAKARQCWGWMATHGITAPAE